MAKVPRLDKKKKRISLFCARLFVPLQSKRLRSQAAHGCTDLRRDSAEQMQASLCARCSVGSAMSKLAALGLHWLWHHINIKKKDNAIINYVYETEIIRADTTGKTWDSAEEFSLSFYRTDRAGYGLFASVGQPQRHFHRGNVTHDSRQKPLPPIL